MLNDIISFVYSHLIIGFESIPVTVTSQSSVITPCVENPIGYCVPGSLSL